MSNTTFSDNEIAELRRALNTIEAQAPTGPDFDGPLIVTPPPNGRFRRPAVAAVLAALAVALVLLPAALLAPDGQNSQTELENSTLATNPPTTEFSTWSVAGSGSWVEGLAYNGSEFFAYGDGLSASPDGLTWDRLGAIDGQVSLRTLLADGDLVMAAGEQIIDTIDGRELHSAFWVSPDRGQTWNDLPIDGVVMDLAKTSSGFVAGGFQYGPASDDFSITHAALWVSSDGLNWEVGATSIDTADTSSRIEKVIFDNGIVALGGRGPHMVREGSSLDDRPGLEAVTWKSDDGVTWTDESVPSDLVGSLVAAQSTPFGILGLTYWSTAEVKDNSAVLVSRDGIIWEPIQIDAGGWEYTDIAFLNGKVVVSGYQLGSGLPEPIESRIWISTDGSEWESLDLTGLPESIRIDQIEIASGSIVIGGRSGDDTEHFVAGAVIQPVP